MLLQDLCLQAKSKWDLTKVAVAHRVGEVAVCEASVIIAVSSAHRKEALQVMASAAKQVNMMACRLHGHSGCDLET